VSGCASEIRGSALDCFVITTAAVADFSSQFVKVRPIMYTPTSISDSSKESVSPPVDPIYV